MAASKYSLAKLILSLALPLVRGYQVKEVTFVQGQEANLIFSYPCDGTEVTLQQSIGTPFYRSTDGPSALSLPENQIQRFRVKNKIDNGNCSLKLTIRELNRDDGGTYILFVYKDGEILHDDTRRVQLKVNYPSGKASCVVGDDKGGDWVSIDCSANAGNVPGKIECYQNGEWIPPQSNLVETGSLLKQTIRIRKAQPAFCCSSTLNEYKERCECNDTALFVDDTSSKNPCPTISTQMSITSQDLINRNQSFRSTSDPSSTNTTTMNAKPQYDQKAVFISSIVATVMLALIIVVFTFKVFSLCKQWENRNMNNDIEILSVHSPLETDSRVLMD